MDAGWDEVERMAAAANATDAIAAEDFPNEEQIARWQKLFKYTRGEALTLIQAQRGDLTRTRISDSHWELVRAERESQGHDRETYEHSQQLGSLFRSQSAVLPGADGKVRLLFRLGGMLGTAEKVKDIAKLEEVPEVVQGQSGMGKASFCVIDEEAMKALESWLAQFQIS
jgi:hypothetical protein